MNTFQLLHKEILVASKAATVAAQLISIRLRFNASIKTVSTRSKKFCAWLIVPQSMTSCQYKIGRCRLICSDNIVIAQLFVEQHSMTLSFCKTRRQGSLPLLLATSFHHFQLAKHANPRSNQLQETRMPHTLCFQCDSCLQCCAPTMLMLTNKQHR